MHKISPAIFVIRLAIPPTSLKKFSPKLLEEGDPSPFFLQKVSFSAAFVKFLYDSDQGFCPLSVIPIAPNLTNEPREKRLAYTDLSKIKWYRYASAGGPWGI